MKTVYLTSTGSEFQANLLEEALINNRVEYYIKNANMSAILPNSPGFEIEFYVYEKDYEQAKELLKNDFPEL